MFEGPEFEGSKLSSEELDAILQTFLERVESSSNYNFEDELSDTLTEANFDMVKRAQASLYIRDYFKKAA